MFLTCRAAISLPCACSFLAIRYASSSAAVYTLGFGGLGSESSSNRAPVQSSQVGRGERDSASALPCDFPALCTTSKVYSCSASAHRAYCPARLWLDMSHSKGRWSVTSVKCVPCR